MNFELWVSIVNSQKDFGQYRDFLKGFPSKSVGVMTPTTPTVPRPLSITVDLSSSFILRLLVSKIRNLLSPLLLLHFQLCAAATTTTTRAYSKVELYVVGTTNVQCSSKMCGPNHLESKAAGFSSCEELYPLLLLFDFVRFSLLLGSPLG